MPNMRANHVASHLPLLIDVCVGGISSLLLETENYAQPMELKLNELHYVCTPSALIFPYLMYRPGPFILFSNVAVSPDQKPVGIISDTECRRCARIWTISMFGIWFKWDIIVLCGFYDELLSLHNERAIVSAVASSIYCTCILFLHTMNIAIDSTAQGWMRKDG